VGTANAPEGLSVSAHDGLGVYQLHAVTSA
jgi:hypothetical protein